MQKMASVYFILKTDFGIFISDLNEVIFNCSVLKDKICLNVQAES